MNRLLRRVAKLEARHERFIDPARLAERRVIWAQHFACGVYDIPPRAVELFQIAQQRHEAAQFSDLA